MNVYYITFRSVTFAQRGERLLQKRGIACTLQRTPKWMEQQGCGYCLRLRTTDIGMILHVLQTAQISMRKVYIQTGNGTMEEWKA